MKTSKQEILRLPAIEVRQGPTKVLYTFAVDGKLVPRFAAVSRVRRADDGQILGYQRPEVLAHIEEIRRYVQSAAPLLPNAVVIAFDTRVRFVPQAGAAQGGYARPGEIVIPLCAADAEEARPGFIVDGQQRLAAIRKAQVESFPICVSAFITDDMEAQTEQFILVNSTKPLPKGLIYELLPATHATLPALYARRRLPAELVGRLNGRRDSALFGLIQTVTNPNGIIKDNSMLRMIEQSMTDGMLHRMQDAQDEPDVERMLVTLVAFWGAVKKVFDKAWGLKPKQSRLMHGVGIVSLGFVMDAIGARHRAVAVPSEGLFVKDLLPLREVCCWTDGHWDFGPGQVRKWNELQNTSKDIQLLSHYLLVKYKELVWERRDGRQLPLVDPLAEPSRG